MIQQQDTFQSRCTSCGHDYDGIHVCPKCGRATGLYCRAGLEVTPRKMPDGVRVFVDGKSGCGDQWCAVYDDFVNLQESPAGFGHNQVYAINDLLTKGFKP